MLKKNFENVLYASENKFIGLYLTKDQFVEGILLDVKQNHIVLEVNEDIVYFAIHQIQAISKCAEDLRIEKQVSPHLVRNDLTDVLIALRYHWITLNRFSYPTLFGVLSSIFEDHIILINNKELLYIPISHITDISSKISKSDYNILNKKEQLAIQKLYRLGISKGFFGVIEDNLVVKQDRIKQVDIGNIANVKNPINIEKIDRKAVSSLLTGKADILVSNQIEATIDVGNTDTVEENTFSPHMEEELESLSLNLAAGAVNISVSDQEEDTIDDSFHTVVMETINRDKSEGDGIFPQIEEKPESISLDLADSIILVSEKEVSAIDVGVQIEVIESINMDALEEDDISPQLENQIITEQINMFPDEYILPLNNSLKLKGKDVLLTAWSTMNSDQSTVAIPKKAASKSKLPTPSENTMMTNRDTGLNEQTSFSNQLNENLDLEDKIEVLDIIPEASEKKKPLITVNVLSQKEINEMLEQQYFALMNYAAVQISNAINFKQTNNKSYFHPRVVCSEYSPDKIKPCEMINAYPTYDSKQDTVALEKQYISLMRHATTMYRKLRQQAIVQ